MLHTRHCSPTLLARPVSTPTRVPAVGCSLHTAIPSRNTLRSRLTLTHERHAATTQQAQAIKHLLDLKLDRLDRTKKPILLLSAKIDQMRETFRDRIILARIAAADAKNSTANREPDNVLTAKLDASDKALTVARSVKVYLGGLE